MTLHQDPTLRQKGRLIRMSRRKIRGLVDDFRATRCELCIAARFNLLRSVLCRLVLGRFRSSRGIYSGWHTLLIFAEDSTMT
jgi:hypothetical protein